MSVCLRGSAPGNERERNEVATLPADQKHHEKNQRPAFTTANRTKGENGDGHVESHEPEQGLQRVEARMRRPKRVGEMIGYPDTKTEQPGARGEEDETDSYALKPIGHQQASVGIVASVVFIALELGELAELGFDLAKNRTG
jgi:hypothetical protein